jgi:hypothetical protein
VTSIALPTRQSSYLLFILLFILLRTVILSEAKDLLSPVPPNSFEISHAG